MPTQTPLRPTRLEDLGIERKPFYTPTEVAAILQISDQSLLDRIHAPAGDARHVYAIALGPRTYRIPVGTLAQLVGIAAQTKVSRRPRRVDEFEHAESAMVKRRRK